MLIKAKPKPDDSDTQCLHCTLYIHVAVVSRGSDLSLSALAVFGTGSVYITNYYVNRSFVVVYTYGKAPVSGKA